MLTICLQHHQGGPKCAYIDCEKQHPGCSDENGKMYKHGDKFVPKSSCDTCTCNDGRPDHCTSCAYYAMGLPRHCPDTAHCNKEHPGCLDKNGKMHKHGAKFVPTSKDPCKVCICKDGKHHECRIVLQTKAIWRFVITEKAPTRVVAAFNQEKALVEAFSMITNLRMDLFEILKH